MTCKTKISTLLNQNFNKCWPNPKNVELNIQILRNLALKSQFWPEFWQMLANIFFKNQSLTWKTKIVTLENQNVDPTLKFWSQNSNFRISNWTHTFLIELMNELTKQWLWFRASKVESRRCTCRGSTSSWTTGTDWTWRRWRRQRPMTLSSLVPARPFNPFPCPGICSPSPPGNGILLSSKLFYSIIIIQGVFFIRFFFFSFTIAKIWIKNWNLDTICIIGKHI